MKPLVVVWGDDKDGSQTLQHLLRQRVPTSWRIEQLQPQLQELVQWHQVPRHGHAPGVRPLVGGSTVMEQLRALVARARGAAVNVIITGESGAGKEVVAQLLRRQLPDGRPEPFVAVDAATIQSTMAESLLFGHERGAFTGAEQARKGLFEEAHGGTIYFDEVANMPLDIQAKLLRVVQEKEIMRLGSSRRMQLQFRVVCATNRDLEALCQSGQFRYDLYARLGVFAIRVPPLREHRDDILPLVEHLLQRQLAPGRTVCLHDEVVAALLRYHWPGNVRELHNVVHYMLAMSDGDAIGPEHLPQKLLAPADPAGEGRDALPMVDSQAAPSRCAVTLKERVKRYEGYVLAAEYARLRGNISGMARALGIDRSRLYGKLREHGIHTAGKRA